MTRKIKYLLPLSLSVFLFSCEKEELPIPAHDPGDVITSSVSMESDYRYQLFFDLGTNTMVKKNMKTDWDLGFETSASGINVILNGAKYIKTANTGTTNFTNISDTLGYSFLIDMPSGSMDSTAIGTWSVNNVYIIDRGFDELGAHQGFSKVELISVSSNSFNIHFSNLNGTNDVMMNIPKDDAYNFTFLSLDGNIASIEPPKENWDIMFSQYTHYYYDDETTYLVTGCLSNRNKVEVAEVFDKDFLSITINDINNYSFSPNINMIGYDWKEYVFSTGQYTVYIHQNYIIKSTEGKYFKLHFIDFYDEYGVKGTPTFEFQEL
ncbi:MAG: HmuY family protein [Flavobacteriales bacterium]|nr:HmuY family protein [Flavobacteriales bacterium]